MLKKNFRGSNKFQKSRNFPCKRMGQEIFLWERAEKTRTSLSLTLRCPRQHSACLQAVPDSTQPVYAVPDSTLPVSKLSRTALSLSTLSRTALSLSPRCPRQHLACRQHSACLRCRQHSACLYAVPDSAQLDLALSVSTFIRYSAFPDSAQSSVSHFSWIMIALNVVGPILFLLFIFHTVLYTVYHSIVKPFFIMLTLSGPLICIWKIFCIWFYFAFTNITRVL